MFVLLFFVHFYSYWFCCYCFRYSDIYSRREIQAATKSLCIQLVTHLPLSIMANMLYPDFSGSDYPNWYLLGQIPVAVVITDALFYYSHRIFHSNSWLYENIHKLHHEYVYTTPVAALYTHPIEHIFVNLMPVALAILITRLNYSGCILYTLLATTNAVRSHSSSSYVMNKQWICLFGRYCSDMTRALAGHDLHHIYRNVNFGTGFYMFDRIHNTRMNVQ